MKNDCTAAVRELYWDEDNRLMVLSDNGKTSRYTYNHAGERIVKSYGDMEGVYINGAPQGITFHETDEFTLYPASIISVNKNRFTKHYFIGDKRIASRIGSGKFNNVYGRNGSYVTAGQQDYAERMNQIESQKEDYYKELGIAPGVPTMKGAYGDPENTGVGYNTIITELGDHSVPEAWAQYARHNDKEDTAPGAPIAWDDPVSPEEPAAGYGFVADNNGEPEETFFYHSDHLGSTSYITDDKGNITQYDAYLPYGELLVDEHSSSEDMPYKFNGKELDEETGLYYYGARYMQPVASIWYGIDQLTEMYPNMGAYVYCAGNPVKLVDSDGNRYDEYDKNGKKISNLGGNLLDFYHNNNGSITVVNKSDGAENVIRKDVIGGYTHRSNSVKPTKIAEEFLKEEGPVRSLFTDFTNSKEGPFRSLESCASTYLGAALDLMKSGKGKDFTEVKTSEANPLTAGPDMWEQMIGEAGISYYNLGDKVLFVLTDSKSNTSLFYHLPFVKNRERGGKTPWYSPNGYGNTYQTYMWTLPTSNIPVIRKARQDLKKAYMFREMQQMQCR